MKKDKELRVQKRKELKEHIKLNKGLFAVYLILRTSVIMAIIAFFIRGDYESVFICFLSLVLFMIPAFVEKNLGIDIPNTLQIVILLFIFSAEILGELQYFYIKVSYWDTMLHTVNGFICAAIGLALVDILNQNQRFRFKLSPVFISILAICFSMTVGVLWEFFEFGCDFFLKTDMQKDQIIKTISSVALDKTQTNTPVIIKNIEEVTINGELLEISGYLDIGLYDTMKDLFVNFIGALVFSFFGYFYITRRGTFKFLKGFIPTLKQNKNEKDKGRY